MATAAVTYTFTNGTSADASEVNTNFTALTNFLNNSVVHRDGSKALTAAMDAGGFKITSLGTPTASTDAATKAYVDGTAKFTRTTDIAASSGAGGTVTFESETTDTDGWWSSGTTLTCPASGVYALTISSSVGTWSGTSGITVTVKDTNGAFLNNNHGHSSSQSWTRESSGVVTYIPAGTTITVTWQESASLGGSGSLTQVDLTITRLALI